MTREDIIRMADASGLSYYGMGKACPRCCKRLPAGFVEISIHTCTPPKEKT